MGQEEVGGEEGVVNTGGQGRGGGRGGATCSRTDGQTTDDRYTQVIETNILYIMQVLTLSHTQS